MTSRIIIDPSYLQWHLKSFNPKELENLLSLCLYKRKCKYAARDMPHEHVMFRSSMLVNVDSSEIEKMLLIMGGFFVLIQ